MYPHDGQNLTDEEIRALPLDLKVCFYLTGFNHCFPDHWIDSVETWVDTFGVFWDGGEKEAREEFQRLYDFLTKYVVNKN